MSSAFTIIAEPTVQFWFPGMPDDERETANPTIELKFTFVPGYPELGSIYGSGGEPACPAEVEFISAKLIDGDGLAPTQDQIDDWARKWLDDEGYDAACEVASAGPDPDDARQARIDDQLMGDF